MKCGWLMNFLRSNTSLVIDYYDDEEYKYILIDVGKQFGELVQSNYSWWSEVNSLFLVLLLLGDLRFKFL